MNELESGRREDDLAVCLAAAVDAKGLYYPSHSEGVEDLCRRIATQMGLPERHVAQVATAGLLHDAGKLMSQDSILLKPSSLSDDEFDHIKYHPVCGEELLIAAGFIEEAMWVRHHHERYDGTGYPDGLAGEDIPVESRIICVADACHAIQANRSYRRARSMRWALAEIGRQSGKQFCPAVVSALQAIHLAGYRGA